MFWQREYLREHTELTVGATAEFDLPKFGLLGSLTLKFEGDEVSGYGRTTRPWRLIDLIDKIEIIGNGAVVIKSLTGLQCMALAFYDQGVMPPSQWRNYASNTQVDSVLINFGRFLHDPDMGLDLAKWNQVTIKITNSASAATFANLYVGLVGHYLRDANSMQFAGYLRTEEWRNWLTVQNATEYNIIPTEHILRRILLQAIPTHTLGIMATGIYNLMDDVELSLDTGVIRVFKGGIDDLMRENYYDYGKTPIMGMFPAQNADVGLDTGIGFVLGAVAGAGSQSGAAAVTFPTLESANSLPSQKFEAGGGASDPHCLIVTGMAPFLTTVLGFDTSYDPMTWLDPNARKSVKLDIHTRDAASAAGGRNYIILDRLVKG